MHIGGSHVIAADHTQVWLALHDPDSLQKILPDCEVIKVVDDTEFTFRFRQRVGPKEESFTGTIYFSDEYPVSTFIMTFNAASSNGMIRSQAQICLEEGESDNAILFYDGEVDFGGRLAGIEPRLLETSVNSYIRRSLEGLSHELGNIPERFFQTRVESSTSHIVAGTLDNGAIKSSRRWLVLLGLGATLLLTWRIISAWRIRRLAEQIAAILQQQDVQ